MYDRLCEQVPARLMPFGPGPFHGGAQHVMLLGDGQLLLPARQSLLGADHAHHAAHGDPAAAEAPLASEPGSHGQQAQAGPPLGGAAGARGAAAVARAEHGRTDAAQDEAGTQRHGGLTQRLGRIISVE